MAYKFQIGPAQLSGALTQEGNIVVHNKAGVVQVQATEAGVLSASSDLSAGGGLDIAGNADIDGTGDVGGTLTCSKASGIGLAVTSNTDLNGTLDVAGFSQFNGDVSITGAVVLAQGGGNTRIDGNSQIGQASTLVTFVSNLASNFVPNVASTRELGASNKSFRRIYVDHVSASLGLSGTLANSLDAASGAGITAFSYDNSTAGVTVAVSGAAQLTNAHIVQWDDTNGKFVDSKLTETGGNVQLDSGANFQALSGDIKALSGDLSASANLDIGGAADIAGALTADGQVQLAAAGVSTTVRGTLGVVQNATFQGNVSVQGNTTLGDAATDTVQFKADVSSSLLPFADSAFDIGADTIRWKEIYGDTVVASQLSGALKFSISDVSGSGLSDFTFNNSANVTVAVSGATDLSQARIVQWDDGNGKFVDSLLKQDGSDLDLTSGGFFVNSGQVSASANIQAGGGFLGNGLQINMNGATITGNVDLANDLDVVGNTTITGILMANGDVDLGNAAADTIAFSGSLGTHIIPDVDSQRDLGSDPSSGGKAFRNLYVDNVFGNISFDTETFTGAGTIASGTDFALANFGSTLTLQLPAGADGKVVRVKRIGTGLVRLSASVAGEEIFDELDNDLIELETMGAAVTCVFSGSSGGGRWYII